MEVTNNSDIRISDEEIKTIVKDSERINLLNKTSEIIVSENRYVTLVIGEGYDMSRTLSIGRLTEKMRWGLDD